jgi:hypothetical protein
MAAPIIPKLVIPQEEKEKRDRDRERMQSFLNNLKDNNKMSKNKDVKKRL